MNKCIINEAGTKEWFINGKLHREDGPAVVSHGSKYWFINGLAHRKDGPAIELADGHKEWWKNDNLHREDGPAVIGSNGDNIWYINGLLHREDGPAVEYANGSREWWIRGERLYPKKHLIKKPQTEDEMLAVFNQYKFVKANGEFYFINQYIKKFKKEWYEKYRLLFK